MQRKIGLLFLIQLLLVPLAAQAQIQIDEGTSKPEDVGSKSDNQITLTIEQAVSAEYFSLENGTKELRLTGPLVIQLIDSSGVTHTIKAQYVVYNRDTKEVKAIGSVEYTRQTEYKTDIYRGESIAVDLDDNSGVFIDGSFNMESTASSSRKLIVHFESLISRSEEVISLANGSLTACDEIKPHYILRAKKIWLFESGDWAASNAILYVGAIPVMWLPLFYYPSKASKFHPVVGFRSRAGGFLQTTTYLAGAQSSEAQKSSMLSTTEGALGSFGTYISRTQPSSESKNQTNIAILGDVYSSLGVFAGLRGELASTYSYDLSWLVGAAFSRSVFLESTGYYSPYDSAGDYASVWNKWKLASIELPMRILLNFEASSKKNKTGLKWQISLPFYSDPFVEQDFMYRNESYDFFSILGNSSLKTIDERSSFSQKASLSWSWNPSIEKSNFTFRLSNLSSSFNWKSKYASTTGMNSQELHLNAVDPQRHFFYPDSARIIDNAFTMSGNILQSKNMSLKWTSTNSGFIEDRFYSSQWQKPQDIDFGSWYWLYGGRSNADLTSSYSIDDAGLTFQVSTGVLGQLQYRPYLYDERTNPTTVHPFLIADYGYNTAYWSTGTKLLWEPFKKSNIFSASKFSYSIQGKVARLAYEGLDGSGIDAYPIYKLYWLSWDPTMISDHSMLTELSAKLGSTTERLSFKVALPPLLESYTLSGSTALGLATMGASYVISRKDSLEDLKSTSLTGNLTLKPTKKIGISANAAWDFDTQAPLSLSTELSAWSFNARFVAQKASGYIFKGSSWIQDGTQYFRPSTLSLSWKPTMRSDVPLFSKDTIGWSVEANGLLTLNQNLIQSTNSTFGANLGFSIKNSTGLSFNFTLSSVNSSFWRYYASLLPKSDDFDPEHYSKNFFLDLWDSMSIWDMNKLKNTLFKLQSLKVGLSMDAHDWVLSANIEAGPELVTASSTQPLPHYEMEVAFNLAVTWKDIPAIKGSINYSEGAFER